MQTEPELLPDGGNCFRPEKIMELHHAIVGMSWVEVEFIANLMKFYKTPDAFIDAVINKDLMANHIKLMQKVRESHVNGGMDTGLKAVLNRIHEHEKKPLTRLLNLKWPWPSNKA